MEGCEFIQLEIWFEFVGVDIHANAMSDCYDFVKSRQFQFHCVEGWPFLWPRLICFIEEVFFIAFDKLSLGINNHLGIV